MPNLPYAEVDAGAALTHAHAIQRDIESLPEEWRDRVFELTEHVVTLAAIVRRVAEEGVMETMETDRVAVIGGVRRIVPDWFPTERGPRVCGYCLGTAGAHRYHDDNTGQCYVAVSNGSSMDRLCGCTESVTAREE